MKRLRAARRRLRERREPWPHWEATMRVGIGLFAWAAISLILLGYDLFPGRLSLQVGEPSPVLVRAPRAAQYVDEPETRRLREAAAESVEVQYSPLPYAAADAQTRVSQEFVKLAAAKKAGPDALRSRLKGVPEGAVTWVAQASAGELSRLENRTKSIVGKVMEGEVRDTKPSLRAAREEAREIAAEAESNPSAAAVVGALASEAIAANRRRDEDATQAARDDARHRVEPVLRTIEADQVIVFEGERVTREHLDMLRALGLSSPRLDYRRLISTILIVGLVVLLLGLQTRHWAARVFATPKWLLLLSLLAVAALFTVSLLTLALPNSWMLIVPAASLMAAALLADTIGMALALALSIFVGLLPNAGLPATLLALGSAVTALAFYSQLWPVSRLRVVVGALAATNLVLVLAAGLLQAQNATVIARDALLAALLYAPGAAALALGGIYMLQRPFGITTHLTLLELLNPQQPLLKRLQNEAPGTYHHSLMVANLAEAAAEAISADPLLTRVGALYHDIGKLYRPGFFVENQSILGVDNVHDRLSSSLSGLIIISHVKDGVALAGKYHLPPEVVNIIGEHHGAMTMSYFYHQALNGAKPEDVSEDHFRYPGPLPSTKESALVMLADGVEAAAKALPDPTPQRLRQLVKEIVREREHGQLERCDLTFRELTAVETVLSRDLATQFRRNRVVYPEKAEGGVGL